MSKKNPKGKTIKRMIAFNLTEEQKAKKGEAAAKLNESLEAAVEKKKEAMSDHSEKIKGLTAKIRKFLHELNEGKEQREVECVEVKNFESNTVEYWFEGENVFARKMEPSDRQEEMDLKPKRGPKWQTAAPKKEFPVSSEDAREKEEIAQVVKMETSRKTKRSSVDGPLSQ